MVILSFPKVLCFGELERSLHSLGKTYQVPRGGNLHQFWPQSWGLYLAGMPPHPLLGVIKGWLGHCRSVGFIPFTVRCLCPWQELTNVQVSRLVGLPQQIGTNLQFHLNCQIMRHGHPPCMGWVRSSISVVSFESLDGEGVISVYWARPVYHLEGCVLVGVQTWVFKSDLPLQLHQAGGVPPPPGLCMAGGVHLPPGLYWAGGSRPPTACTLWWSLLPSMTPKLPSTPWPPPISWALSAPWPLVTERIFPAVASPTWGGAAKAYNMPLKLCCCDQCPMVGFPGHP